MPETTNYSDGSILLGGRLITIGVAPAERIFVATNINRKAPTREVRQYGADDKPSGAYQISDFETLSATFQGKAGVAAPARHETFGYCDKTWVVTSADTAVQEMQPSTWSIEAREVINPAA